ncbi:MAG TPA: three-Cys-motif partner protein TcmP [Gammaproteobacteria bacterium]|nr:three-Cys-motif partner protein TcmP [Gammaproteobacteria bacterium]
MTKKEYGWRIGKEPPVIEPHSLTKHRVYEEYLLHYVRVLNTNPLIPNFQLTIVDGFAGGGAYFNPLENNIYSGSPIRMIKAVEAAEALVNENRRQQNIEIPFRLNVDYFFVEKKATNYKYLTWYLENQGFFPRLGKDISTIQGEFTAILPKLLTKIASKSPKRRCIFLLDQYGYKDVPFPQIRKIFSRLPNAEIILTFATDWLIDYMSETPEYRKTLQRIGMEDELNTQDLLEKKEDNQQWRYLVQSHLHKIIPTLSNAKYYTPFFILSRESNKSFWLVHLSNHPRAREVMTELHWQLKNHFSHYGGTGLQMFGYDPLKDGNLTGLRDLFTSSEFSFDEVAREQTLRGIVEDLPRIVFDDCSEGITVGNFYSKFANQTPATTEHLREAIHLLSQSGELIVCGVKGERRRKPHSIRLDDIIQINSQYIFDFGRRDLVDLREKKGD